MKLSINKLSVARLNLYADFKSEIKKGVNGIRELKLENGQN